MSRWGGRPLVGAWIAVTLCAQGAAAQETGPDDRAGTRAEHSGRVAIESRWFPEEGLLRTQRELYPGLVGEVRSRGELRGGRHRWVASLFARAEAGNDDRTHLELREAAWTYDALGWRLQGGVLQRTWGVVESNPLVDIVNQRDLLETPDLHAKLGQPGLAWAAGSGGAAFEVLALPFHRARRSGSSTGRFHAPGISGAPSYEGSGGPRRIDLAGRGSLRAGGLDLGATAFRGTSREPVFLNDGGARPYYRLRTQVGLDGQFVLGSWSFKTEAVHRTEADTATSAVVVGVERTIGDIAHTGGDLSLIVEASWDERGRWTPTGLDRDLFLAARWSLNDAAGTDLMAAALVDQEAGHQITRIEARRRWREDWTIQTELYLIARQRPTDAGYPVRRDSYLRVSAARHY